MGNIRRGTISRDFVDALKLDVGAGVGNPTDASEKIVLTYDYSNIKYCDVVETFATGVSSASASTIYTAPTDRDFYLTGYSFSIIKDAACDTATGTIAIQCVVNGATKSVAVLRHLVTTAQNQSYCDDLSIPIKVDRGSIISISGVTYTAGAFGRSASIRGYTY